MGYRPCIIYVLNLALGGWQDINKHIKYKLCWGREGLVKLSAYMYLYMYVYMRVFLCPVTLTECYGL